MLDLLIVFLFDVIVLSPAAVAWVTQDEASHPRPTRNPHRVPPARSQLHPLASSSLATVAPPIPTRPLALRTSTLVVSTGRSRALVHTRTSGVVRAQTRRW